MEKLSTLEVIGAFSKAYFINEMDITDIYRNFKTLKESNKYGTLLDKYDFNNNEFPIELLEELSILIESDKAVFSENNKTIFFTIPEERRKQIEMATTDDDKLAIHNLLTEYLELNNAIYSIEKQKV